MASTHKHLRSSTANKRPTTAIADGQIALNTNTTSPGLFFKDSTGATIIKVGPVHVGAAAPNASPAAGGSAGNSVGEIWLDTSLTPVGVKIWNGSAFVNATPIGSTTVQGLLELATNAETQTGTDPDRAVTPAGLQSKVSDSTSTTSSTTIASSTAVKSAYDLANAALPKTGGTVTGNLEIGTTGSLSFEGATADAFETTIAVTDPTADRTITLPDTTGTIVTTGDTGTVTSTMIADGTIVNADVNASAAIAGTKISPDFGSQTVQTTGIFSHALGTAGAPTVTFTGDTNTGIYSPGADQVAISTGGSGRLFVDASGRILVGNSATTSVAGFNGFLQLQGTNFDTATVALTNVAANNTGSYLLLGKARGGTLGGYTSVNNGDNLGQIRFMGADGTGYVEAAYIGVTCNGVPGTNNMPGRLFFSTNSGTSSVTERMCITPSGLVGVGTSSPDGTTHIHTASAGTVTANSSADDLVVENSGAGGISILTPDGSNGSLFFGTPSDAVGAAARWNYTSGEFFIGSDKAGAVTKLTSGDGTTAVTIDSSQRVGIGTSDPSNQGGQKLTVRLGSIATSNSTANSSNGELRFIGTPDGVNYNWAGIRALSDVNVNQGTLAFFTSGSNTSAESSTERMRIDSSGRVGIGTTSPGQALEVAGSGVFSGGVAGQGAIIGRDGGTGGATYGCQTGDVLITTASTTNIRFTTNSLERARIDSSGRLLVGTSSGSDNNALLKVQGNASGTSGTGWIDIRRGLTNPASGSQLGLLSFSDASGNHYAFIEGYTDAATGINDYPGRLVFSTTADGASSPTERMRVTGTGLIVAASIYNTTTANAANVNTDSNGALARSTSSAKYKTEIEGIDLSYSEQLLNCRPVWYRSLCEKDNSEWSWWGFIAEEVAAIDPRLVQWKTTKVTYDKNGSAVETPCEPEPEGVAYDRFVPHLLNLIKRQKEQIEAMEARLTALESA